MCELDEAFDRARSALPEGWKFTSFTQDAAGWLVSTGKVTFASGDLNWYPALAARAGTLTKALNRLADKLEERNEQASRVGRQDH